MDDGARWEADDDQDGAAWEADDDQDGDEGGP